jgi:hypothetical protein
MAESMRVCAVAIREGRTVRDLADCLDRWAALLARPAVTPAPAPQHCTATDHTVACVEVAKASQAAGEGAECIGEGAPQPVGLEFPLSLIHDARESAEKMERADGGCLDCLNDITHADDGHEGHADNCDVANILDRLDDLEAHLNNSAAPATEGGK